MSEDAMPCYECEYDLRSIPDSARCPECGADANLSRQRQSLLLAGRQVPLVMTSHKWIRTIAAACCLTIFGELVLMMAAVAFLIEIHTISMAIECVGAAFITAGYLIFSQREPASPRTAWTRTVAVTAWLAPLFGLLFPMVSRHILVRTDFIYYWWRIFLVNSVFVGAVTWVLMRHLEKLAHRADAEMLRTILSLLKWLAPVAFLCQPFLSTYLYIRPHQWMYVMPEALIGYSDFIVIVAYSMFVFPRLNLELVSVAGQAMIAFYIIVMLSWFSLVLFRASFRRQGADE